MAMATTPRRAGVLVFLVVVVFMAGVGVYILPYQDRVVVVKADYRKDPGSTSPAVTTEQLHAWIPSESKDDFMTVRNRIQENRRSVLKNACRKYYTDPLEEVPETYVKNTILVDEQFKLLYCFVPKIASTNWKRVFLVLKGIFKSTNDITQYTANRSLRKLNRFRSYTVEERTRILQSYTKFLFVRHPYSRILSAFKNKLSPESDFERAEYWRKNIGMPILWRYRGSSRFNSTTNLRNMSFVYDLRFDEFVKYVSDPHQHFSQNKHWKEIYKRCMPCEIDYDIIGKFETLTEDAKYILKLVKADDLVQFPKPDASSPTNSSNHATLESYYKNVSSQNVKNLVKRYSLDFALFGYSPHTQDPDPLFHNSSDYSDYLEWSEGVHLFKVKA